MIWAARASGEGEGFAVTFFGARMIHEAARGWTGSEQKEDEGQSLSAGKGTAFSEKFGIPSANTLRTRPTLAVTLG